MNKEETPLEFKTRDLQDTALDLYLANLDLYTRNERMDVYASKNDRYGMLTTYHAIVNDIKDVESMLSMYKDTLQKLKNEIDKGR